MGYVKRSSAASRGYGARWQKARLTYLSRNPLCVMCNAEGKFTGATVVDHIKPHKGDQGLFWDTDNWQGLCATHHSSVKQQVERSGYAGGCDESGLPLDDGHPWGGK